jgi:hypothetical protein
MPPTAPVAPVTATSGEEARAGSPTEADEVSVESVMPH